MASHGGSNNAETWEERTVYYFDVHPDYLEPAMQRFGSFFTAPLFAWSGSRREAKAVNSEFELSTQDDTWRENQLVAHLADKGHPYNRFGCGNKVSLEDNPKAAKVDVRKTLLDFHAAYYSANLMSTVTIGKEPLDTLEKWTRQAFGAAPNLGIERPSIAPSTPGTLPISAASLPFEASFLPLEQGRTLTLCWFLPPQLSREHWRCKVGDLLGHLIGHEGAGSVTAYLKKHQLIGYLMAGFTDNDSTTAGALFKVVMELTKAGLAQIETIIKAVCCYVGMLAAQPGGAPPAWLWEEMRDVNALHFRFAETEPEMDYARRLSMCMIREDAPTKRVLAADYVCEEYMPELVAEALRHMTPERLFLLKRVREDADGGDAADAAADGNGLAGAAPAGGDGSGVGDGDGSGATSAAPREEPAAEVQLFKPGGKRMQQVGGCVCAQAGAKCAQHPLKPVTEAEAAMYPESEPWYGTKYRRDEIAPERLAEWRGAYDEGSGSVNFDICLVADSLSSHFHLPEPNEFIPTDFALRNEPPPQGTPPDRTPPALLCNHADGCLFFKPDRRFRTPKAHLWLGIRCLARTSETHTVADSVLATLAVNLTLENLNEASYAATCAGLDYGLTTTWNGFEIAASGFSHKLPKLALRVCEAFAAVASAAVEAGLFERVKQKLTLELQNEGRKAGERAGVAFREILQAPHFLHADKLAALAAATPAHLEAFLRAQAAPSTPRHVNVFAAGNLAATEAKEFYEAALIALRVRASAGAIAAPAPEPTAGPAVLAGAEGAAVAPEWQVHAPYAPSVVTVGGRVLPRSSHCYRVAATHEAETNVCVTLLWQLGEVSEPLAAKVGLLSAFMFEPLFDQLRTKEQLGYAVHCAPSNAYGMLGFEVQVTSSSATPAHIEERALAFLDGFVHRKLPKMRAAQYTATLEATVANMLRDDLSLDDEYSRYQPEIETRQYVWDRAQREAAEMRNVTQGELAAWARQSLLGDGRSGPAEHPCAPGHVRQPGGYAYGRGGGAGATPIAVEGREAFKARLKVFRQPEKAMPPLADA